MTKIFASISLLALLFAGGAAGAGEATGWITHLDGDSDRFYLDDGRVFGVSEDINFGSLRDRVRVKIYYDTYGSDRIATDIELAPAVSPRAATPRSNSLPLCSAGHNRVPDAAVPKVGSALC